MIEQCGKCWALWSLVVFDPNYDSSQNNVVTVFNGRFYEVLALFVTHCESCAQDIKTVVLEIRVFFMSF